MSDEEHRVKEAVKQHEAHERAAREYADAVKSLGEAERQLAHHAWWAREHEAKTVPQARQKLHDAAVALNIARTAAGLRGDGTPSFVPN